MNAALEKEDDRRCDQAVVDAGRLEANNMSASQYGEIRSIATPLVVSLDARSGGGLTLCIASLRTFAAYDLCPVNGSTVTGVIHVPLV